MAGGQNGTRILDEREASFPEDVLLADAVLGRGLPHEAERLLAQAALSYHLGNLAETYLLEAHAIAPDHAAVLIGLYRYYFYKGRLCEALDVARACLEKAARDIGLAADWRRVEPGDAVFGRFEAILPRFYLFSLKGYAYLQMRLGNLQEGRDAALKLVALDPSDKIGASVLIEVAARVGREDDD
jgi:tetratricopeptide (TPR) repeat protein